MTEKQKQTVIEMLEGIIRMTNQEGDDTMPEWTVKVSRQRAQAALRIVRTSATTN